MFVRVRHDTSRKRPRWRIQVVENQRFGSKVRQTVLREIGTAYDEVEREQLRAEGQLHILTLREQELNGTRPLLSSPTIAAIRAQAKQQFEQQQRPVSPNMVDMHTLYQPGEQVSAGNLVWSELYSQIGWDQVLGVRRQAANRIVKEVVLGRLEKPSSKRQLVASRQAPLAHPPLSAHRIYQTMDYFDAFRINKILQGWRQRAQGLLTQPVSAVFYDTTTLAFESAREDLGELRRKGYSKDGRPHDVQVLFALLITPAGLPLGYRVYPGNRYEGNTLLEALESLQAEGFPADLTVVADAGLCSQENRQLLREHGYSYVLGRGVRTLPQRWHAQLFDREGYHAVTLPDQRTLSVLDLNDGEQRIIVTYCASRARKDAQQRTELLDKLRAHIGTRAPSKKVMVKHQKKFLSVSQAGYVELNEAAIQKDARWDGLHAIVTHHDNPIPPLELLTQYRELWQIEDCFRTQKHELQIRPVYHWKDRRIQAHLILCFMAFCCLQELRFRLRARGHHFSVRALLNMLDQTRLTLLATTQQAQTRYVITQPLSRELKAICSCVGVHWPRRSFELPRDS